MTNYSYAKIIGKPRSPASVSLYSVPLFSEFHAHAALIPWEWGSTLAIVTSSILCVLFPRYVWSEFLEKSDTIFPQLLMMLTHFGFACEVPAVGNDLDTAEGGPHPPCYLIPWFFSPQPPRSLRNNWPLRANARQVREGIISAFWASYSI
jgi:hypothetical protein